MDGPSPSFVRRRGWEQGRKPFYPNPPKGSGEGGLLRLCLLTQNSLLSHDAQPTMWGGGWPGSQEKPQPHLGSQPGCELESSGEILKVQVPRVSSGRMVGWGEAGLPLCAKNTWVSWDHRHSEAQAEAWGYFQVL